MRQKKERNQLIEQSQKWVKMTKQLDKANSASIRDSLSE